VARAHGFEINMLMNQQQAFIDAKMFRNVKWRTCETPRIQALLDARQNYHTLCLLRTTIILDDELGKRLRHQARLDGKSFSAFLADAGRRVLESRASPHKASSFKLITFRGNGSLAGIDLDKTNAIIATEDGQFYGDPVK